MVDGLAPVHYRSSSPLTSWCPPQCVLGRSGRWEPRDVADPAHASSINGCGCQRLTWSYPDLFICHMVAPVNAQDLAQAFSVECIYFVYLACF